MPTTVSTVTVPVTITPEVDTAALEASIRAAVASALRVVADELSPEKGVDAPAYPVRPHWTPGATITVEDLDMLPVGAVVADGDGDHAHRLPDHWCARRHETLRYARPEDVEDDYVARTTSGTVASYGPVTLVSLP